MYKDRLLSENAHFKVTLDMCDLNLPEGHAIEPTFIHETATLVSEKMHGNQSSVSLSASFQVVWLWFDSQRFNNISKLFHDFNSTLTHMLQNRDIVFFKIGRAHV